MGQAMLIAAKDRTVLLREKNFLIILGIFIFMSIASAYIGWSSQHTVTEVYRVASAELISAGRPVPPPPYSSSKLLIIKNMIIYAALIGALLSVIIGHTITVSDRKAAVTRVLFTRLNSGRDYLLGKIIASTQILAAALILSFAVSIISLSILNTLSGGTFLSVTEFYLVTFLYLSGYLFLGIYFGMRANNSTKAVLIPILIWAVITFAIPQASLALYPTGSLNPVLPQTNILSSPTLSLLHSAIYPFSVSEHYKELSAAALKLNANTPSNITKYTAQGSLTLLALWAAGTLMLCIRAVKSYSPEEGDTYE